MYRDQNEPIETFLWDDCFVTGLAEIDSQHQGLVAITNQLGHLVMADAVVSPDEVTAVVESLSAYARYHFREEEAMMVQAGLNRQQIKKHQRDHASFLLDVAQMHADCSGERPETPRLILKFLTNWLVYHILGVDMIMARQVAARRQGKTIVSAEDLGELPYKGPVALLLNAMHELYRQLSERNMALNELNRTLEAKVEARTEELRQANRSMEVMAMTDVLTGLPNRRHAQLNLGQEWTKSLRSDTPLSCLLIDADGFKQINDNFGHDAGDEVLRILARQLKDSVRAGDDLSRTGGDEFMVICPGTSLETALHIAERIRRDVATLCIPAGSGYWQGSISVGVACRTADMSSQDLLIKAADEGMYLAKERGRNCVATAQTMSLQPASRSGRIRRVPTGSDRHPPR